MRKFGVDPNSIQAIFITHLHGDHFGGLPFVILDAQLVSRRAASLTVTGPIGLSDRLFAAMEVLFPSSSQIERHFALDIRELEPEKAQDVLGVKVTAYLAKHPSGAHSFALRFEADYKVLCYSGDREWVDNLLVACGWRIVISPKIPQNSHVLLPFFDAQSGRSFHRTHTSREGRTPDPPASRPAANLRSFRWQPHRRALYQTPVAA